MRSLFQFVQCLCSVQIFVRGVGGGGVTVHKYFLYPRDLYAFFIFCLCFVCGLCAFRFHPLCFPPIFPPFLENLMKN